MIEVDDEGLARDGADLTGSATPCAPGSPCQPAAHDAASVAMAAMFNGWDSTVSALLDHAAGHRLAGGVSVAGSAGMLAAQDVANAATISAISGGGGAPAPADAPASTDVPMIAAPVLPSVAALPPTPPPMTGEQIAQYVHNGPGSESVRNLANTWRTSVAGHVTDAADQTLRSASSIDQHWQDGGQQQAGSNTAEHADWLSSQMHSHVISLADRADEYAAQIDQLRSATPRPEEFTELHQRLNRALAIFRDSGNPAPLTAVSAELAEKQGEAIDAYSTYFAAAATTAGSAPTPPPPAPPIVRGGQIRTLQPTESTGAPKTDEDEKPTGNEHGEGAGGENPLPELPGEVVTAEDPAVPATPTGAPAAAAADTTLPGVAANVAGTIVGAVTGTASQLAGGLPSTGGASMIPNALSSLSSAIPSMGGGGMPSTGMPSMPTGGEGSPTDDLGLGDEFDPGATTPASSGGSGGGGGGGASVSSAGPAVGSSTPVAAAPVAPISSSGPSGAVGPTGAPMGGMYPPMMGGLGGNPAGDERNKDGERRVVLRPVPNTEPVFGAVERKRSTGGRRRRPQEEGNHDGND